MTIQYPLSEKAKLVMIDYTNWRGERRERLIMPHSITFGHNDWHKENQWLLLATDQQDNVVKTFALANIHSWIAR